MQLMQHLQKFGILAALVAFGTPAFAQYQPAYQNQGQGSVSQPMYGAAPQGVFAQPGMPNGMATGMMSQPMNSMQPQQASMQAPSNGVTIQQWFSQYDQIRRQAQMNPMERQQADSLMSRGLSILVPGDTKLATKQLLGQMVGRYQRACAQLKQLPLIPPTQQLHTAYYNYFSTAGNLFSDYLRVQDNLLVTDATTGQPLAAGLIQRKQMLEGLEGQCKQMDAATRNQFGVPPYQY